MASSSGKENPSCGRPGRDVSNKQAHDTIGSCVRFHPEEQFSGVGETEGVRPYTPIAGAHPFDPYSFGHALPERQSPSNSLVGKRKRPEHYFRPSLTRLRTAKTEVKITRTKNTACHQFWGWAGPGIVSFANA